MEVARTERDLLEHGDGLSLTELVAEANSQDRDRLLARLQEIETALGDLSNERQRIGRDLEEAKARLRQMQGPDAASQAAEARQQALANMGERRPTVGPAYHWSRAAERGHRSLPRGQTGANSQGRGADFREIDAPGRQGAANRFWPDRPLGAVGRPAQ